VTRVTSHDENKIVDIKVEEVSAGGGEAVYTNKV
jgi:hypothetical protein